VWDADNINIKENKHRRTKGERRILSCVDEGPKRAIGITAAILAARKYSAV